jgi:RimJ/RimL family protein N-acetyltransferase
MPVIDTPRLILRELPLEVAEAIVAGRRPSEARWAPGYPTDSTLVAASIVVTAEAQGSRLGPWTSYQIVLRDTGCAVGGCGFMFGPPDGSGDVQISFSIVEAHKEDGYAAEAVRALIAWAHGQPDVIRVRAETAASNAEGIRVYEAAGMRRAGWDGQLVFFEA